MLSMRALEPGVDMLLEAGIDRLRAKSVRLTEYLIFLADQWLTRWGFRLGSPRDPDLRGSHVSLRHPAAFQISQALSHPKDEAVKVIADFREPDNLRLGVAPLYNTFSEIHTAVQRMQAIVSKRLHERYPKYPSERATVT
jgi:kynureninase